MFQIFQNNQPTSKTFDTLAEATRYAAMENMGSDHSTFTVKMKQDWMSTAEYGTAEHSMSL